MCCASRALFMCERQGPHLPCCGSMYSAEQAHIRRGARRRQPRLICARHDNAAPDRRDRHRKPHYKRPMRIPSNLPCYELYQSCNWLPRAVRSSRLLGTRRAISVPRRFGRDGQSSELLTIICHAISDCYGAGEGWLHERDEAYTASAILAETAFKRTRPCRGGGSCLEN